MPKINVEIISLFFHHTSFFAVNSNNSVTLDVARKKKNESGKTRLLRVKMSLLCFASLRVLLCLASSRHSILCGKRT